MKRLLAATFCLVAWGCHGGIFDFEQTPDRIEVRPTTMTFTAAGNFDSFNATVFDTDGFVVRGIDVAWTSSDVLVATVNSNGGVVSQGDGFATITATALSGTLVTTAEVNVVLPVIDVNFVSITAGGAHTCALTPANDGYCWGANSDFQLRDGFSNRDSNIPVEMDYAPELYVIAAGDDHNCALRSGSGIRRPVCWGRADAGQVGQVGPNAAISNPRTMIFQDGQSLASGDKHSCFVNTSSVAYCWANNTNGQVGDGTTDIAFTPTEVLGGHTFDSIAAHGNHTCALTPAGEAYCWGQNDRGQLGDGTNADSNVPVMVSGSIAFTSLSGTCGLTAAGEAYCWGDNNAGQLGDGTTSHSNVPVAVSGGLTFQTLDSGLGFVCGLTTGGDAYCWGDNSLGQLGNGSTTNSSVPVMVTGGMTYTAIAAGGGHACAIAADADAYCWGGNNNGQLGDGTNTDSNSPVRARG